MSESKNRGGLGGRLASHFALCGVAAASIVATQSNAEVVFSAVNWTIPATTDGLYIKVDTQQTGATGGALPGWDLNPWGSGTSAISFFWASTGPSAGVRLNTAAGANGSNLSRLPVGYVVGAGLTGGASGASFGTGGATFASTTPGFWSYNSVNHFGFRFTTDSGSTHYGWARMQVGANAATRTITGIAFESVPGAPIEVGNEGGPPPAYDPCAPFNPTVAIGANSVNLNQDTAGNLTLSGCGGTAFKANYFKFVPPESGNYSFSTCSSSAATRMAILDGCTPGSSQLACNDDSCGSSSSVSAALTGGATYYVVVGGESAGSTLPSPIAISVEAPANPNCAAADTANFGSNIVDTTGITSSLTVRASATGTSTIYRAKWLRFTPGVTGAYTVSACGAVGDTKIAIGASCPGVGQTFDSIAYNDDACACTSGCGTAGNANWASRLDSTSVGIPLTQDLVAGQTYYIIVGGFGEATAPIQADVVIDGPPPVDCPADLDGDGVVGGLDLSALLAAWGQSSNGDVDGDSDTDGQDLTALLAAWGSNGC